MSIDNTISRIDPSRASLSPTSTPANSTGKDGKQPDTDDIVGKDQLHLTDNARRLQQIEERISHASDVSTERTDKLSQMIEAGEWHPQPETIASKMLSSDSLWKNL